MLRILIFGERASSVGGGGGGSGGIPCASWLPPAGLVHGLDAALGPNSWTIQALNWA